MNDLPRPTDFEVDELARLRLLRYLAVQPLGRQPVEDVERHLAELGYSAAWIAVAIREAEEPAG